MIGPGAFVAALLLMQAALSAPPNYTSGSVLPSGARESAPLAPGMLVTIYGERLGPAQPCAGTPDPIRRETPSPARPNQTRVETQVFPKQLCGVEVRVRNVPAGLLYVSSNQINLKIPQETPVTGFAQVRATYNGRSGPSVTLALSDQPNTASADALANEMWSALQRVTWDAPYTKRPSCAPVPPHKDLRFGLYAYAFHCAGAARGIASERLYYPVAGDPPTIRLRRADFRLANAYPEMSVDVEQLLKQQLTRAYGKPTVPDNLFEIGANRPAPGLSWQTGNLAIFLHRNRNYVAPVGVREGIQLIAVRREILQDRETAGRLAELFQSSAALSRPAMAKDLAQALGARYVPLAKRAETEAQRMTDERRTRRALLRLLAASNQGDSAERAAVLVAADDLVVRLGSLLVARRITRGSEQLTEVPETASVRRQLAAYNVKYSAEIGHYSGDLEYDRSLLRRAWKEFPETPWGQRAFLMLQQLSCYVPDFGCQGPNCFLAVIRQGEEFLRARPHTQFRKEQLYHLALAYETWWSLSHVRPGDSTANVLGLIIPKGSAGTARQRAIELYQEIVQLAPNSPEAQSAAQRLPALKLGLDTAERTFFCFSC